MGNSSGIAAIARLTAPSNARVQGSPRARLSPNSAIATMTATTPRRRTRTPAFCCSGLAVEAVCATRAAMPPYCVAGPVVVTRPNPCPATTWDPAKNLASGGASPGVDGHSRFDCGSDSPVREDSSNRQVCDPTDDAVGRDDVPFTQDEQVAGHDLLEWDRHNVPIPEDIR